jgi:DNA invertase Pin-like site-specific DNA recombinase
MVIVWRLDRLSRDLRDGINVLADWSDKGLKVVSVTQQIEFNGAFGKLLSAILLGVA